MEPPKGRMEPLKGRMEPPRFAYRTSTQSREILNYKTTSINDAIVEQGCILYRESSTLQPANMHR